jgi:hypothetical protein
MTTTVTPHINQDIPCRPTLFVELGARPWKLGGSTRSAQRPRERSLSAGDGRAVLEEIGRAKQRFGCPDDVPVVSC